MDALHWDTFEFDHEPWDSDVHIRAQELIRQCPCNRYLSRCLRCRFAQLLLRRARQYQGDVPEDRKSPLEIVCSLNRLASSRQMETETLPEQDLETGRKITNSNPESRFRRSLTIRPKRLIISSTPDLAPLEEGTRNFS